MKKIHASSKLAPRFNLPKETLKNLPVKAGVRTGMAGCRTLSEVTSCALRLSFGGTGQ